jgi:hypothetical protein
MVILERQSDLLEIVDAAGSAGCFPRGLHRRQQEPNERADDGNYHQELDQGESVSSAIHGMEALMDCGAMRRKDIWINLQSLGFEIAERTVNLELKRDSFAPGARNAAQRSRFVRNAMG